MTSALPEAPEGVVLVVERDRRFAVIRPPKRGGRPELPGGRREPHETSEEAARREGLEELGVSLLDLHLLQVVTVAPFGTPIVMAHFTGRVPEGAEIRGGPEGPVEWMDTATLLAEGTFASDALALNAYKRWHAVTHYGMRHELWGALGLRWTLLCQNCKERQNVEAMVLLPTGPLCRVCSLSAPSPTPRGS